MLRVYRTPSCSESPHLSVLSRIVGRPPEEGWAQDVWGLKEQSAADQPSGVLFVFCFVF